MKFNVADIVQLKYNRSWIIEATRKFHDLACGDFLEVVKKSSGMYTLHHLKSGHTFIVNDFVEQYLTKVSK